MSVREDHSTTNGIVNGNDDDDGIADWGELERFEENHQNPHRYKCVLEFLYWSANFTQPDIAERYGITQQSVSGLFKRKGVKASQYESGPLSSHLIEGPIPYRVWFPSVDDCQRTGVYGHQLVALLNHEPEAVFGENTEIHHKLNSGMALDLPANIEVVSTEEHRERHSSEGGDDVTEVLDKLGGK
jgi:hypothetical protein